MSLNRFTTAVRSSRHNGLSAPARAASADRTVSPVTTMTPTSPTNTSSSTEPHAAVQACRKPPMPTPRAPPAAPSSSTPSPRPGRPLDRCSKPVEDTSSRTPPSTILTAESDRSTWARPADGSPSARSPLSPAPSTAPPRRPPQRAAAPIAASPTGRAMRTRPKQAARALSTPSPSGPAAENQTLPATRRPAMTAARPQMSRRWRLTTEPTAAEPRREARLPADGAFALRELGSAPLVAMKGDATSDARPPREPPTLSEGDHRDDDGTAAGALPRDAPGCS